jgi:hypothetical protein
MKRALVLTFLAMFVGVAMADGEWEWGNQPFSSRQGASKVHAPLGQVFEVVGMHPCC